jgi:hypothetical protein
MPMPMGGLSRKPLYDPFEPVVYATHFASRFGGEPGDYLAEVLLDMPPG